MGSVSVVRTGGADTAELLFAWVSEQGSASHPYFIGNALTTGAESGRNMADALHFLCALHGRHPGVIDLAAGRTIDSGARAWLLAAGEAMHAERQFLGRLAVAAGPVPSTPGGANSEPAVIAQRNALSTLAQSDRHGCALGAALAFAADWSSIRAVLDSAARRLGIHAPAHRLGTEEELRALADSAGATAATERALLFGAQQMSLQHRALWDLLEARQQARLAH